MYTFASATKNITAADTGAESADIGGTAGGGQSTTTDPPQLATALATLSTYGNDTEDNDVDNVDEQPELVDENSDCVRYAKIYGELLEVPTGEMVAVIQSKYPLSFCDRYQYSLRLTFQSPAIAKAAENVTLTVRQTPFTIFPNMPPRVRDKYTRVTVHVRGIPTAVKMESVSSFLRDTKVFRLRVPGNLCQCLIPQRKNQWTSTLAFARSCVWWRGT